MRSAQQQYKGVSFTWESQLDEAIKTFLTDFSSSDDSVLCHTSGSTGEPKPIWVNKSAMRYSAKHTIRFFDLGREDTALLCLPSAFIAGRMMLVRALVSGMKIHAQEPSLNPLLGTPPFRFDFAAFTPAQVKAILENPQTQKVFGQIKHIIIGGAAVDMDLERSVISLSATCYATYGMTETVSHIALRKLGEIEYRTISKQTQLGVDEEQCLWIEDANLTDGRLQTNDVVNLIDGERFVWLGRRDFVINSGGLKLHPEQIEEKIRTLDSWEKLSFFIDKKQDATFGERPILVGLETLNYPLLESLAAVLDKKEMPLEIKYVPQFYYTETGKLNRKKSRGE